MFLLLGLSGELQINVVGELGEVAEAFLPTANTIPREAWGGVGWGTQKEKHDNRQSLQILLHSVTGQQSHPGPQLEIPTGQKVQVPCSGKVVKPITWGGRSMKI